MCNSYNNYIIFFNYTSFISNLLLDIKKINDNIENKKYQWLILLEKFYELSSW